MEDINNINEQNKKNIIRRIFQVALSILIFASLFFISSGKIAWIYAWIYILISNLFVVINSFLLPKELIAERGKRKENIESWDKIITLIMIITIFSIYIISGLDIRFGWTARYGLPIYILGFAGFISGNSLVSWAMVSNKYFSTAVRIQVDRNQSVADSGPYSIIRHPGYLGMILYYFATPVALGSIWGLIPAAATLVMFIIRTAMEDKTLKLKLEGYEEYAERVKFRILPGIW